MLLRNATAVVWHPASAERTDLRIAGDTIVARGPELAPVAGEEVVDLAGRVVIAGMVNAHTHLYSALARGMPPPEPAPRDFRGILNQVWWRLDRALDLDGVEASALAGALDAAACGTTTLVDHHASPSAIRGSLERVRRGVAGVGLRAVLCYEVTDRGGAEQAHEGLAEHRRWTTDGRFRLAVGAHASFTLESATLAACATLARELGTGVHIHVAEDPVDERVTRERWGVGLLERLRESGVLGPRALLAHAVHLAPGEMRAAAEAGCRFLHNPRSNMNNAVGYAPAASYPEGTALGTDGIGADLFAEARFAFFKAQDAKAGLAPARILRMLQAGQELAAERFGRAFGTLQPGCVADLAVLDYDPPTPITGENLAGHLLFGLEARHVSSVIVGGAFVVRDRRFVNVDAARAQERARAEAVRLWARMREL